MNNQGDSKKLLTPVDIDSFAASAVKPANPVPNVDHSINCSVRDLWSGGLFGGFVKANKIIAEADNS